MGNSKQNIYISQAIKQALKSPMKQRLGAIIVCNNKIVSQGYNKPYMHKQGSLYSLHAEMDALTHLSPNYKNCIMYVVRIKKINGELALGKSKPCNNCENKLMKAVERKNLDKIIYVNQNFNLIQQKN